MSIVIFFGMAFFIFVLGCVVVGVTFYRWHKERKEKIANQG